MTTKQEKFLKAFTETRNTVHVCKAMGICATTPYGWANTNPEFATQYRKLRGVNTRTKRTTSTSGFREKDVFAAIRKAVTVQEKKAQKLRTRYVKLQQLAKQWTKV